KLFDKPGLAQSFFEFYDQPGIKPEDKPITKAKCKIEGCQTQYVWHETTLSKPYSVSRQQKLTRDLERPIKWLTNDLENSNNNDHRRDGVNIRDKLLSNEEFNV
ncbi:153_t:CDS:2, partial [Racocetra persica]